MAGASGCWKWNSVDADAPAGECSASAGGTNGAAAVSTMGATFSRRAAFRGAAQAAAPAAAAAGEAETPPHRLRAGAPSGGALSGGPWQWP